MLRYVLSGVDVQVESAGTRALVGSPSPEQTQRIGRDHGAADIVDHRARQLTKELIEQADLVFAMSKEHRAAVAEMLPRSVRRTFTIREFARLASHVQAQEVEELLRLPVRERLRATVETVAQLRGTVNRPEDGSEDDVVDPYLQSDAVYEESTRQLMPAVNSVSSLLRAVSAGGNTE